MTFQDFNFEHELEDGLEAMGFNQPTPIQQQAIPIIINNKDLIACAQTGTGKTAAFVLPILNKLLFEPEHDTNTLIVVPTRELALQIDQAIQGFAYYTHATSLAIYGGNTGQSFDAEKKALTNGANIIIATPGRLLSHLNLGYVNFKTIKHFILDEADKMLDMGFLEDIVKIAKHLPEQRQTLMFSATMPSKIRFLAQQLLKEPEQISIAVSKPAEKVLQAAYVVYDKQKNPLIKEILSVENPVSTIIFSSTKQKVKQLAIELKQAGLKVNSVHSDLEQREREDILLSFRSKQLLILVATDVLSRGIDIEDIGMVINYDVPGDAEDYIHRIGRTARAASSGVAITFINENDMGRFGRIEKLIGSEVRKLIIPVHLGEGPIYNPDAKPRKNFSKGNGKKRPFKKAS